MMYLIGLGLWDESDLSLKSVNVAKACDAVYCELYTAVWKGDLTALERLIEKQITVLPRGRVESGFLVGEAQEKTIALLVPGDPLTATTHVQLLKDCVARGVTYRVVHGSSIHTAIAEIGLDIYKFGRATTLPLPAAGFAPMSPYEVIVKNMNMGLHTLVLLDTADGMTVHAALDCLKSMDAKHTINTIIIASRLGSEEKKTVSGDLHRTVFPDLPRPAVIIVPGSLSDNEREALELLV